MFEPSARSQELRERLLAFFDRHVIPNEALFHEQIDRAALAGAARSSRS